MESVKRKTRSMSLETVVQHIKELGPSLKSYNFGRFVNGKIKHDGETGGTGYIGYSVKKERNY